MNCCELCEDKEGHQSDYNAAMRRAQSAMSNGDMTGYYAAIGEANDFYADMKAAVAAYTDQGCPFGVRCDDLCLDLT